MKEKKIIFWLFIFALILRLIFSLSSQSIWWDEAVYANLGYDLSQTPLDYSLRSAGWSDFIPFGEGAYDWPNIGFRAPLLPYSLAVLNFFSLGSIAPFFMIIIGALSVVGIYFLGKSMFSQSVGIYAALLLSCLPIHVYFSTKILTGVYMTFFLILTFYSFWQGYEKDKTYHKILFGLFFALALLTRYTALWVALLFPMYFLIRDRSFKFITDRNIWYAIGVFTLALVPWFIYGYANYRNVLGGFIHGAKAAPFWGGTQSSFFFVEYSLEMFALVGILFVISISCLRKQDIQRKPIIFMILLAILFLFFLHLMPHKETRFIIPFVIPLVLICANFLVKLKPRTRKIIVIVLIAASLIYIGIDFQKDIGQRRGTNDCFLDAMDYLNSIEGDITIINDESAIIYHYTKQNTLFFPSLDMSILQRYRNNQTYIIYSDMNMPLYIEENQAAKDSWDAELEKEFECEKNWGLTTIYR